MRRAILVLTLMGAMLFAFAGVVLAQTTTNAPSNQQTTPAQGNPVPPGQDVRVCPSPAAPGTTRCHAIRRDISTTSSSNPTPNATPSGYGPADLQSAYNLATAAASKGSGATVAIVDAYDDPNAESDLNTYRSTFNLPALNNGGPTFKKVNQTGGTTYPRADSGWAQEISLDLDMVSAICPNCNILLVEAKSNYYSDLLAAEDYAASVSGVVAISNSWGSSEFSSETTSSYDGHFNKPGKAITVSSGDSGYGVDYPAASQYVTAVGGTSLTRDSSSRGWSETVWSGAGSGCSAYEPQPKWQSSVTNITGSPANCAKRAVADVSADADPNTGVAVYDTYQTSGWLVFGGTSVASPIISSVYALAGNASTATASPTYGGYSYSHTSSLYDITSGSNCGGKASSGATSGSGKGSTSSKDSSTSPAPNGKGGVPGPPSGGGGGGGSTTNPLCTSVPGWDGPTGNGTPNGTDGF